MHQERLVTVQPLARLEDTASRVEQQAALVADVDIESEVVVPLQEVDDHLPVVVDIDGDVVIACCRHTLDDVLQHGLAGNLDHCLGTVVS